MRRRIAENCQMLKTLKPLSHQTKNTWFHILKKYIICVICRFLIMLFEYYKYSQFIFYTFFKHIFCFCFLQINISYSTKLTGYIVGSAKVTGFRYDLKFNFFAKCFHLFILFFKTNIMLIQSLHIDVVCVQHPTALILEQQTNRFLTLLGVKT